MEEIKDRIEIIMDKEGLNPNSFAVKVGTSDTVIRNILNGKNFPGYEITNKILQTFLWVDANWLIIGKGRNHRPIEERIGDIEKEMQEIRQRLKMPAPVDNNLRIKTTDKINSQKHGT